MQIEHHRAAMKTAIAERAIAERTYEDATAAAAVARSTASADTSHDAQITASNAGEAASEARSAFFAANDRTFECADAIVEGVASADVVEALRDPTNVEPSVVAWREARNALVLDADAALPLVEA